jgi:hypothetical protein
MVTRKRIPRPADGCDKPCSACTLQGSWLAKNRRRERLAAAVWEERKEIEMDK